MSLESVKGWLAANAPDLRLIEVAASTATVDTAARVLGVEPGRIAKTLAVRAGEQTFLLCARGDARLDNRKCKDACARECSGPRRRSSLPAIQLAACARSA
jgi:prolyl-tRNA editing enzyme YbaK/EbsC (Cys-tRNA(Pro) deacylase)